MWDKYFENSLATDLCEFINQINEPGDIIEFGTGSGETTDIIAKSISKERKIFTFDGFQGLPETKKVLPRGVNWSKGSWCFNENTTRQTLSKYSNVIINKTMTWDLKIPSEYGISKIIAANMDLDLYEGTLDGLRFIGKCDWNKIILRFDDWGCYSHQIADEIDQHEKAAFFDWIEETKYQYEINQYCIEKSEGRQSIIVVNR